MDPRRLRLSPGMVCRGVILGEVEQGIWGQGVMDTIETKESGFKAFFRRVMLSEYFVLYLIVVYVLCLTPIIPHFWNWGNFVDILSNLWPLLAVAIGQTFVLIIAGIDLSQSSIMALSSVFGTMLIAQAFEPLQFDKTVLWGRLIWEDGGALSQFPLGTPIAVLVILCIGAFIGLVNGLSVAFCKMPPFIVTLVSAMFFGAVAVYLPASDNIMDLPESFIMLGDSDTILSLPLLIVCLLAVLAHVVLSRTVLGKQIYAIGINRVASRVSGVPVERVTIFAFMISGVFAAIGGMLYTARFEMGRPTLGSSLLLDVVGANVIGGISLMGGKGKILWTALGALFFVILSLTLSYMNLDFYIIDIVKGTVILGAASLDVLRTRLALRNS